MTNLSLEKETQSQDMIANHIFSEELSSLQNQDADNSSQSSTSMIKKLKNNLEYLVKKMASVRYKEERRASLYTYLFNTGAITLTVLGLWLGVNIFPSMHLLHMLHGFSLSVLALEVFIGLLIHVADSVSYGWIGKKVLKGKQSRKLENEYEQTLATLESTIHGQEFQHAYIAHLQLQMNHLQTVASEMKENNQIYDHNTLCQVQYRIEHIKSTQASLINDWLTKKDVQEMVKQILTMEEAIANLNERLRNNQALKARQKKFMQEHNQFLKDQGLTHVLDNSLSPEKIKSLL